MVPLMTNKAASFPVNPAALVCRADENNENQMLNFAEQRVSHLHLFKTTLVKINDYSGQPTELSSVLSFDRPASLQTCHSNN